MLSTRLTEGVLLGVLRFSGYQAASHLPEEWVRWLRSRNVVKDMGIPSPRVYLKLVTQGFDIDVLRGAESVLETVLALQTEIAFRPIYNGMHEFASSLSQFQACGFEVVDFTPVTRDTDQLSAVEMDCVMVRKLL